MGIQQSRSWGPCDGEGHISREREREREREIERESKGVSMENMTRASRRQRRAHLKQQKAGQEACSTGCAARTLHASGMLVQHIERDDVLQQLPTRLLHILTQFKKGFRA